MKSIKKYKWLDFGVFQVKMSYLLILVLLSVILAIIKPVTIYIDLFVIALATAVCLFACAKEVKNKKYRIDELSKSIDIVLKDSLNIVDTPMVMLDDKTKIIWQNKISKHILPKEYIIDSAIKVKNRALKNDGSEIIADIGNGEIYLAVANSIRFSSFDCTLISYINRTNESKLKDTLKNTKVSVGIIFVDNYEETMQGLDEINKSEITSKIAKEIRSWVSENGGVVNKIDKDRFIVFIERQYVEKMESSTFEILERVRNITNITKLPITVSLGISYQETSLEERYNASTSALDIALGRGGDQAVIKNDKKFNFYGGSNLGLEKTSRVRARTISQALKEIIEKSDKVYVMGHKNSDIDCIGAAVGISKMASTLNKSSNIVVDSKCNSSTKAIIDNLQKQEEYKNIFVNISDLKKQDFNNSLLVIVDTHKKSYLAYPDLMDSFEKIIIIDHHRRGPEFIENAMLTYHEIYASSTSELVTEILMYLENIVLTSAEAESLYAGIVVDTKNFVFKTGVRTFEVAAYLKKFGIDISQVKQLFQNDFETYMAKIDIVKNAQIYRGTIAISTCEEELEDLAIVSAQAADELLSISGILASFVLSKTDGVVMISGRSMGDINVQTIMEVIGGGGHLTFAGAQIAGVTIEEAKNKLIESIENYFGKD